MPTINSSRLQILLAKFRTVVVGCIFSLFSLHPVWADDTEIFFNSVHGSNLRPNLLFILDASISMDKRDGTRFTRLERMQDAMNQVLDNISEDVNVGLMRFGGVDGGRIIYPVTHVAEPGVKDELKALVDEIDLTVGTPTVGALEEAWRYYNGDSVRHGLRRALNPVNHVQLGVNLTDSDRWIQTPRSRVSHPDSYTGGTVENRPVICDTDPGHADCADEVISGSPIYKSPIVSECQANFAILLSDGEPWVGPGQISFPDEYNKTIDLGKQLNGGVDCTSPSGLSANSTVAALCGQEFVAHMYEERNIVTHSIGFNIKSDWIRDLAAESEGGEYREAASSSELLGAIDQIVGNITVSGAIIAAPAVTIDQFTRLSHREEVYLAVFQPEVSTTWAGNLKKYKFNGADPSLKDAEGNEAVDANTGEFLSSSRSFWSESPDGGDIIAGGAANRLLDPSARNLYSDLEAGTTELTATGNKITTDNIDHELFGIASGNAGVDDAVRDNYVRWLSGVDVLDQNGNGSRTDARRYLGDPLHTNPTVVTYGLGDGNDRENLDSLVFFGTNEGFLHAVDTNTGDEEYAFMPQELLQNVPQLFGGYELNGPTGNQPVFGQLSFADASQSTTGFNGVATRAIDGNTDGAYHAGRSVTHTASGTFQSWWEGELSEESYISGVRLWNRTDDCCAQRLADFSVFVSSVPFTSDDYDTNVNDPTIWSTFHGGTLAGDSVSIPVGREGRYVRIQHAVGGHALSLAEVEAFGATRNEVQRITGTKIYGMDGDLTLRTVDRDNNGLIEHSESDKAYLYAGMRRGGRNYYALDISQKGAPETMWTIKGGEGDFTELGHSWSKPLEATIKVGSDVKDVLVFGGGYDVFQDYKEVLRQDTAGRSIYFVDVETGELVWSGSHPGSVPANSLKHKSFPEMNYSIPADLSLIVDQETGYLSQIYVGDMGARIWRFDVNNGNEVGDLVDGGIIADFGVEGSPTEARRFFASPDLSLVRVDGELTVNIAIGSGYRAHPLNTVINDRFFVVQYPYAGHDDEYGIEENGTYRPITSLDLFNTTDNLIAQGTEDEINIARTALEGKAGWFFELEDSGEKVLDTSTSFQGVVRFITYVPSTTADPCDPGLGTSFFYAVNLLDGSPFEGTNEDEINRSDKEHRREELPTSGISPPVNTIFVEHDGEVTATDVSGVTTLHEWETVDRVERWFWAELPD